MRITTTLTSMLLVLLLAGCVGGSSDQKDDSGNSQQQTGDNTGTGDPDNGDPDNGDPDNGDPDNGDPDNGDPDNGDSGLTYTPLYNSTFSEASSQEWYVEEDGTIVTVGSGRGRSRHESEETFYTFPVHYFEHRTFKVEVHDQVAAGEDRIVIYYEPEFAHYRQPECRNAYKNVHRADFNNNMTFNPMPLVEADADGRGQKWVCIIESDAHDGDDGKLEVGEWMEVEFQQFLGRFEGDGAVSGQAVYYTDTYRFKLGQPGFHTVRDEALDAKLRAGGDASAPFIRAGDTVPQSQIISDNGNTLTYKVGDDGKWTTIDDPDGTTVTYPIMDGVDIYDTYVVDSDIADWTALFREALNIQWETHNTFLNGRRIFHTRFSDGTHVEPGNPVSSGLDGLADGLFARTSCLSCHINNGRGNAPTEGQLPTSIITKVSSGDVDANDQPQPHPYFGTQLQPSSLNPSISAEAEVTVNYTEEVGLYDDGTSYSLRRPTYHVNVLDEDGSDVVFHSTRMPQNITGLGLLEAIPESVIMQWHDPEDSNGDGISGRARIVSDPVSGAPKLGRFGWKASQSSLTGFAATALNTDIGVTTSVFPDEECGITQTPCLNANEAGFELPDEHLNDLVVYLQTLGAPSRQIDLVESPSVVSGEALFQEIGCASCHRSEMESGHRHPLAELRGNTVRAYTDLLLHDMGPGLADNLTNSAELNREWRTPPLWGLGVNDSVNGHTNMLHDGRARNIEEAILWHGGEATSSQARFKALSAAQREQLLTFLRSL